MTVHGILPGLKVESAFFKKLMESSALFDSLTKIDSPLKTAKPVLLTCTLLLLAIAIYLKITDSVAAGSYVGRYGGWQNSVVTANGVFFFAAVMAGILWAVTWAQRKDK
jgi:hypothetical protein